MKQLEEYTKIYRWELYNKSLWYNEEGEFEPIIRKLAPKHVISTIPMDFNKDIVGLYSAVISIEEMLMWFDKPLLETMKIGGFKLFQYQPKELYHDGFQIWFAKHDNMHKINVGIKELL